MTLFFYGKPFLFFVIMFQGYFLPLHKMKLITTYMMMFTHGRINVQR